MSIAGIRQPGNLHACCRPSGVFGGRPHRAISFRAAMTTPKDASSGTAYMTGRNDPEGPVQNTNAP